MSSFGHWPSRFFGHRLGFSFPLSDRPRRPASDRVLPALFLASLLIGLAGFGFSPCLAQPDPGYWRLAAIEDQFTAWEAEYPAIFHRLNLGRSGQQRDIPMVLISDAGPGDAAEPALVIHGALHANEPNGTKAIMHSIATLLEGYGTDPEVTARVDGLELYFIPILNVDGHAHVFSGAPNWADWRKTMRDNNGNGQPDFPDDGVDLNRNWDWNWDDYGEDDPSSQKFKGPYPFSEPEIVALRQLILETRPAVVVDYHSPVTISWRNYVFWPWLDTVGGGGMAPDAAVSEDVAELWTDATLNEDGNPYNDIFAYSTLPKGQCWIYGKTGILAYIMEISNQCWWSGAMVDTVGHRVSRGSMTLVDRVLSGPGLACTVSDAATGAPLPAEIRIAEMHQDAIGPRLARAASGTQFRLTGSGTYTVTVTCDGYFPETRTVAVGSTGWTSESFALQGDMSAAGPGPTTAPLVIRHTLGSGENVRLVLPTDWPAARAELFDLRGHRLGVLGEGLGAGAQELALPRALPGGVYLLRVRAGVHEQTERLVVVP